ncbi:FAD-binding oxidoreductase [Lentzea cavernae]|uniref:FAD-binding oxidoreductase n=1 Tax=Lentzea cavernae TaxID=2020703 RepID=UPI001E52ADB1|nr:FAD-binding oxidoreductase [Lentzea cavernae]
MFTEQPAAFRPRTITEVLRPASADEVVEIVRSGRRPLHPVSTGRNWGLGSGLPVDDGAAVLDLSRLDRVRALDLERGYAVVEPGVTQGALAELLRGTPRIFNLTTSSLRTSVIGNVLERGVGVHRARAEDLVGLEVVLADGRREHVGWWPGTSAVPRPHAAGPGLTHLFTQSSFAVVTAAVVRLLPRPEEVRVLPFTFASDDLADAVDALRSWTEQRLVPPTTKVYNPVAAQADGYLAHVCLSGAGEVVEALSSVLLAAAGRSPLVAAPAYSVDDVVRATYAGDPDPADTWFLRRTAGCPADRFDAERGLLMFLPVVPFSGEAVALTEELIRDCCASAPAVTVNVLDSDAVDHVVGLGFPAHDPAAAAEARESLDRLHKAFAAHGFLPHRRDVDRPGAATALQARIGRALDPDGVFAPGRYSAGR